MLGKKGVMLLVVLLAFLTLSSIAYAQEKYDLEVAINTPNIDGFNSKFSIYDFNVQNSTLGSQVISQGGKLKFSLESGFYEISVGVDDPSTPGFDYYGKASVDVDSNKSIVLDAVPVGSRKIVVVDKDGRPLADIPVRIDCDSLTGEQGYFRTDSFGIVEASFLPLGNCTFRAAAGDSVISAQDNIKKGTTDTLTMAFPEYAAGSNTTGWVVGIVILAVIIVLIVAYMIFVRNGVYGKAQKEDEAPETPEKSASEVSDSEHQEDSEEPEESESRKETSAAKEDILTALNGSERKVVKYLLEQQKLHDASKGEFYLHQAKIVHGAGIAKTTLVRLLTSLEEKNIIKVDKAGKIKKIKLTDWFNSK